jgi:hypothetical protein
MSKIVPCQNPVHPYNQRLPKKPLELLLQYVMIKLIKPEARWAIMESDKLQEQLAEAYEHNQDHPVVEEEYEIPEDMLKRLYDKMRKSQEMSREYIAAQNKLWGITNENNK